jgi:murein DD-endopeptidase MepM/ murein hydrolase activator NlpD
VKPGDTVRGIAGKTGSSSELIAIENGLKPPFVVRTGKTLKIPGGRFHTVRKGEAGIAIARAYGVEWQRIVTLNHLNDPFILRDGMRLLLPSEQEAASMSVEQRAAAFRLNIDDLVTGGEPALAENAKPAAPVAGPERTLPPSAAVTDPGGHFSGRVAWPVDGKVVRRFGTIGNGQRSEGINIAAPLGTPILAAADGTVAYVGSDIAIYGGLVLVRHPDGWLTAYGYADQIAVKRGQAIKRGEQIATVAPPGVAMSEPQLHFELRQGRKPVNPMDYLVARK